jgi:hypothetical protein
MKRRTPAGIWVLRGITVTVAVVVILVAGTVAYSAYEDYTAVRSELTAGPQQAVGRAIIQGSSETVSINITVPNRGLYTLNVTVSCDYPTSNVVCQPSQVSVPAGQEGVLRFKMTVADVMQFEDSGSTKINGTVAVRMEPFVSLLIGTDFGEFVSTGGG